MKKVVKVIAAAILFLALCFPPWEHTLMHASGLIVNPAGNHFILSAPPKASTHPVYGVRIGWKAYGAQVAIGLAIFGATLLFLKKED